MLSPAVPQSQRVEAYTEIERFKQSSPLVVECALALARPGGGNSDSVRSGNHFTLLVQAIVPWSCPCHPS